MFRWIVDDTRALIADLRAIGRRLATRWQWMRLKSRRRLDTAAAEIENVRRSAGTRTRMCSACRALIPIDARTCPECGEAPGRRVSRGVTRVIENMMPEFVSVTSVILTLNIAGYGLSLLVYSHLVEGVLPSSRQGDAWGIALAALGENHPWFVAQGEYWRLLSYAFLHGGTLHLLMNSWALLAVSPLIEEVYGSARLFLVYIVTGISGGVLSFLAHRASGVSSVGASGALFGLIGLAAVWGWRRGGSLGRGIGGQMLQWAVYGLVMGVMFHFDNAAHLGGLVAGGVMGLVMPDTQSARRGGERPWDAAAMLCVLLVLGSFLMVALRYQQTLELVLAEY